MYFECELWSSNIKESSSRERAGARHSLYQTDYEPSKDNSNSGIVINSHSLDGNDTVRSS
jgi:hypothetical protein